MSNDTSPWPTIVFVGLVCGLTLGLVVSLFFRRREDSAPMMLPSPELDDDLFQPLRLPAMPSSAPITATPVNPRTVPVARTLSVSSTAPTMILRAQGDLDWKVQARTLGPTAATATFLIGAEIGNSVIVPAGAAQIMRVPRGEYLYALGSEAGVTVTVSGGPEA